MFCFFFFFLVPQYVYLVYGAFSLLSLFPLPSFPLSCPLLTTQPFSLPSTKLPRSSNLVLSFIIVTLLTSFSAFGFVLAVEKKTYTHAAFLLLRSNMKVAAVLLLLGLVAMASASYYVPYYPRYYPKAVAVTTVAHGVGHGIGYGGFGGVGGFGYGGFGGLGGFGYGGFGGLGGFGHGGFGGLGGYGGFGRFGGFGHFSEY